MHVVALDLLAEMRELPLSANVVLLVVGLALWLTGWGFHRFWLTIMATVAAGIAGLRLAPQFGVQPIIAGLVAAVGAGALALSLARVAVFAGCGLACWWAVQLIAPPWAAAVVWVPVGGLFGILFFRFWITLATSAAGAVLMTYSALALSGTLLPGFDVIRWAGGRVAWINLGFAAVVGLGTLFQYMIDRAHRHRKARKKEWDEFKHKHTDKGSGGGPKKRWLAFFRRAA